MNERAPTILVVEDDATCRDLIVMIVTSAGYRAVEATDGEEAIRKIKRRPVDLILLDIMLPGMDGYEVLDRLRAMRARSTTPVIVVSAKGDTDGLLREAKAGAIDHLRKPFSPLALEATVERALASSAEEMENERQIRARSAETYAWLESLRSLTREGKSAGDNN